MIQTHTFPGPFPFWLLAVSQNIPCQGIKDLQWKGPCSACLLHGLLVAPFVFQEQGPCHFRGAPSDVVSLSHLSNTAEPSALGQLSTNGSGSLLFSSLWFL